MKKISFWASGHVKTARLLIVFIKLLLAAMAYYAGMALYKNEIILPSGAIYFFTFLVLLLVIAVYPDRKKTALSKNLVYIKQKTCDFILPLLSFLIIVTMVNTGNTVSSYPGAYSITIMKNPTAQEILASGKTKESLTRTEKKILKKEFFKQLKIYAAAKITGDKETSGKAWKIALAIIVMVGLIYLLAALACSLSCSGSDAAAIIVGTLGLTGIIFGFVLLMKRIHQGSKKINDGKDG